MYMHKIMPQMSMFWPPSFKKFLEQACENLFKFFVGYFVVWHVRTGGSRLQAKGENVVGSLHNMVYDNHY